MAPELAEAIADQAAELAREDRTATLPRHRNEVRFSEMSPAALRHAEAGGRLARYRQPRQWIGYLVGRDPHQWDAVNHPSSVGLFDPSGPDAAAKHIREHFKTHSAPTCCPVCRNRPLEIGWYCLACDRAGLDPFDEDPADPFEYKGFAIGSMMDREYIDSYKIVEAKRPAHRPGKLKGGRR